jgi:hypothetical protein
MADGVTVGSLADDLVMRATREALSESARERGEVRTLADALEVIREYRPNPADAGGVPIPAEWECVRAVLGGLSREKLEESQKANPIGNLAPETFARAVTEGTHLPPGLHIVTGQTGGGKSALAVNLVHAAAAAGHGVLYVSLELDAEEVAARVLGLTAGVSWSRLALRRPLLPDDTGRVNDSRHDLTVTGEAGRIVVYAPDGPLSLETITREALVLFDAHGKKPPLVVFDYLQLAAVRMGNDYRAPLREAIASVTLALRSLSRHRPNRPDWQGCPVLVLSTTARANVKGENAVPGMDGTNPDALRTADLETLKALPKEAGEVEATAVTAWVMALGEKSEADGSRPLTLRLVKNRLGPPGAWVPFTFDAPTGRLTEAPGRYTFPTSSGAETAEARTLGNKPKTRGGK